MPPYVLSCHCESRCNRGAAIPWGTGLPPGAYPDWDQILRFAQNDNEGRTQNDNEGGAQNDKRQPVTDGKSRPKKGGDPGLTRGHR